MTSKEAINELIEGAKNDLNKWELDRLGIIDKDLREWLENDLRRKLQN